MRRVSQVPGKLARSTRMAFLTSRDDVLSTQMRLRIGDGQYIVGTMTIIALCRLRISKLGHLSVIGIEICLRNRLMTATTLLHDLQFETGFVGPSNRVCCMAIIAYGQWSVRLSHERRVDAPVELFLDTVMTPAASLREIFPVYT